MKQQECPTFDQLAKTTSRNYGRALCEYYQLLCGGKKEQETALPGNATKEKRLMNALELHLIPWQLFTALYCVEM